MVVPQYWAESRAQHRQRGRQITVRRFGWSDANLAEAQAHADARVQEALQRLVAGEKLPRHEPKRAYNGADGVPIREEIVSRHGDTIITRNSYGARCLNSPNVLFADVDFCDRSSRSLTLAVTAMLLAGAAGTGWFADSLLLGVCLVVLALALSRIVALLMSRRRRRNQASEEQAAQTRVRQFISQNPDWNLRLYRTPAGLRLLAMHQTFNPNDPSVARCFQALGVDPVYAQMCLNQHCFRARVSAKPWRIGIDNHIRPRRGLWPVTPERIPSRNAWIAKYETAAQAFAACKLIETLGSGTSHPETIKVQALHDHLCGATSSLPLA